LATEVNIPPRKLHFIDPLLKIPNLDILNPLSTLACQNGGVALDVKSLLRVLLDQNFPPSKWVGLVVWPSLMKSILPQKSISLFANPNLFIDSTEDSCDCQVWALDLVAFQIFVKSPNGKSILLWVLAINHVKQLKHNIVHTLGIPLLLQSLICR